LLAVQGPDYGTFLLATQSDSSCLSIDPRQTGVEPRPEPQAPTSEPSAFASMSCAGDSSGLAGGGCYGSLAESGSPALLSRAGRKSLRLGLPLGL